MIIVAGHLRVQPEDRDELLARSLPSVETARSTEGCLDFALAPDPVDSGRVNVFERWVDRQSLERFRADGPDGDLGDLIAAFEVGEYEVNS